MEVIYTLIPGMIFLGLVFVGILVWAVKKGQYDDLEGDGQRLLMDDDEPTDKAKRKKGYDQRNWPDAE